MQRPHDIAYVHTVYGPLSVRLVQQLESPGWRHIRDVLDTLPGPSFEDTQQVVLGNCCIMSSHRTLVSTMRVDYNI